MSDSYPTQAELDALDGETFIVWPETLEDPDGNFLGFAEPDPDAEPRKPGEIGTLEAGGHQFGARWTGKSGPSVPIDWDDLPPDNAA